MSELQRIPQPEGENQIGDIVAGTYQLEQRLGSGAMGVVFKAMHLGLQMPVALKILRSSLTSNSELVARFQREAQSAAKSKHPNICSATDFGQTTNGEFFIAMEFLAGQTLDVARRKVGLMQPGRAIHIARQICAALEGAQVVGVVHRDIKPENIMLIEYAGDPDFVKLLDFGIAHAHILVPGEAVITAAGAVYGTPQYLAPEQAGGDTIDGRADLYSLGVVLFEMLTGRPPFVSKDSVALMRQHIMRPPPRLREINPELPLALDELVAKLLEKMPANRHQSATELLIALDDLALEQGPVIEGCDFEDLDAVGSSTIADPEELGEEPPSWLFETPPSEADAVRPAKKSSERLLVAVGRSADSSLTHTVRRVRGRTPERRPPHQHGSRQGARQTSVASKSDSDRNRPTALSAPFNKAGDTAVPMLASFGTGKLMVAFIAVVMVIGIWVIWLLTHPLGQ